MKYKDLGTMLSKEEMKGVKGGKPCIPLGSGCSVEFQNCGCGRVCALVQVSGAPLYVYNEICVDGSGQES